MSGRVYGKVIAIGESGDLVSDITREHLRGIVRQDTVTIHFDGHETLGIYASDHQELDMTLIAVWNAQGVLELRLTGEHAGRFLGIRPGTPITVAW